MGSVRFRAFHAAQEHELRPHHQASRRFYETVLAPLGHAVSLAGGHFHEWNDFGIAQSREDVR
jgi:hypothetical protein